ncbi:RagB/SusD family nutrient uptake outer membrane protein [Aestuariibaculum sediminum]|uniref:RagB/SusD family nutrient uptake outer membrane protein n=1 Tax=Aestuariibaculum sediminum TaxID=2770637 RepID=A0A8J6Q961_9FLAO|nr:RagB/SusD family nutrient uptake outer membrane protein [Aestuariibaculum sediminum]MBD0832197.1 RagB/SusD family nutrient uptake outer membrane protein [Aestuariibaculum sediminum]
MKKRLIILIIMMVSVFGYQSCNIDENIIDEARGEDLLKDADPLSLLAPAYNSMRRVYGHRWFFALQTFSADEGMVPTRQSDWFDGGTFQELHRHDWKPEHRYTRETWEHITTGLANATLAIDFLEAGTQEQAEAIALLSHYMWVALDAYGQVPYRGIENIDFNADSQILTGAEAVSTIITNLELALPNLPTGKNTVRFTQDAAKSLLARVYLNRAVYEDRYASSFSFANEDMQQVINLTTEIINSTNHALETDDYFSIFDPDNENHKEIIWAVKNEKTSVRIGGRSVTRNTTNGLSRGYIYISPDGDFLTGSDAGCTLPDFLDTWDSDNDPRFFKANYPNEEGTIPLSDYKVHRGFLEGQLYGIKNDNGTPIINSDQTIDIVPVQLWTRDQSLANHTREVSLIAENQSVGVRVSKWGIDDIGSNRDDTGVDIVVFRLAEMYLMRAEAILRSGLAGNALDDVNAVRVARGGVSFAKTNVTLEDVYNERGYEFYWEYHRRTDQIRFGKWEDSWTDKTDTDPNHRIFAIPPGPLATTPGLVQNPGY